MARYRNVCFTLNNPEEAVTFDDDKMEYLVYQEEIGESGTYHFQGYCEFKTALVLTTVKSLLGGDRTHVERRRGTQAEAIKYCKKEDTRIPYTDVYEEGTPRNQGKRVDLEAFRDEVFEGAHLRSLVADHTSIIARYPRFYNTLKMLRRPQRTEELTVTLHHGETGLGKTRTVYDKFYNDDDFYIVPLSNGTMWYDTFDGHKTVLLDDFCGKASHLCLSTLLCLLDLYPQLVPVKGGFTWWVPTKVFVTTNLHPALWYDWSNRPSQYKALARRFTSVVLFTEGQDPDNLSISGQATWWQLNAPLSVEYPLPVHNPMTGLPLVADPALYGTGHE